LASRAQLQALKFGARFAISREVVAIEQDEKIHSLMLAEPRRNLVEHRAEEVTIPFIDQRHAHWSTTQSAGRGEASEAATDNDHPG
jgi:hypothetical protein